MPFAYGFGILLADQWSKNTMRAHAANRSFRLGNIVRFRLVQHRDRSYERATARSVLVFAWVLALICAVTLHHLGVWFYTAASLAGLGLTFGGAASNLLDILKRRYVVDFIDVGWWPVFNLADVAIVVGLAAAFLL